MAPARAARPHDVGAPSNPLGCPFCPGNEDQTPPEVAAVRPGGGPPDSPGWLVRVIPNKFPALAPEEGVHEVVLNSPRHVVRLADLEPRRPSLPVRVWAERLAAVGADPRGLWPFLFLNQGAAAGASLQHTHTQIMGLPFAPPRLVARERAFEEAAVLPRVRGHGGGRRTAGRARATGWWPGVPRCPRSPGRCGSPRPATRPTGRRASTPAPSPASWCGRRPRSATGSTPRRSTCGSTSGGRRGPSASTGTST